MKSTYLRQRGDHHAILIVSLVVALIGLLGFVGFNAWQQKQASAGSRLSYKCRVNCTPSTPPPTSQAMGRFGYATHINRMSDQSAYVDLAKNGGATTIRDDFEWANIQPTSASSYDWSSSDTIMRFASQRNLDVLAMCGYSPNWANGNKNNKMYPPLNYDDYANFVKAVASRYGANGTFWANNPTLTKKPLKAIEVWNEPNIFFWQPTPDPAAYTQLLKKAYPAVKSVDSSIQVVTAGLAPYGAYGESVTGNMNPVTYLEKMYQNGSQGNFDAVGWHPYNSFSGYSADDTLKYQTWSAWSQMNETPVSARSLMTKYNDGTKKIWITEVGAATNLVTPTAQADLAAKEVALWKSYSWAGNYYWYDLRDDCTTTADKECNFGTVTYTNSLKPAYSAIKTAYTAP